MLNFAFMINSALLLMMDSCQGNTVWKWSNVSKNTAQLRCTVISEISEDDRTMRGTFCLGYYHKVSSPIWTIGQKNHYHRSVSPSPMVTSENISVTNESTSTTASITSKRNFDSTDASKSTYYYNYYFDKCKLEWRTSNDTFINQTDTKYTITSERTVNYYAVYPESSKVVADLLQNDEQTDNSYDSFNYVVYYTSMLTIKDFSLSDIGDYSCMGYDYDGRRRYAANFTLNSKKASQTKSKTGLLYSGSNYFNRRDRILIQCSVQDSTIKWWFSNSSVLYQDLLDLDIFRCAKFYNVTYSVSPSITESFLYVTNLCPHDRLYVSCGNSTTVFDDTRTTLTYDLYYDGYINSWHHTEKYIISIIITCTFLPVLFLAAIITAAVRGSAAFCSRS